LTLLRIIKDLIDGLGIAPSKPYNSKNFSRNYLPSGKDCFPLLWLKLTDLECPSFNLNDIVSSIFPNFFTASQKRTFKPTNLEGVWYLLSKMTI